MGTVLVIVFSIMELALCVLNCTKFKELLLRRRNRLLTNAAELVLLLIILLIPSGQKMLRFTFCLILLVLRVIISGIKYLVCRKKNKEGKGKIAGIIIGTIINIFFLTFSLVPALVFTGYKALETSGPYNVNHTAAILVDESRLEAHETDGSHREIPIHFYYPESGASDCPFVLFAHGSFGYYQSNTSLYMELASNGYVVASIDHPYYAFFTKDTDGKLITVDMDFMQACIDITNGVIPEKDTLNYTKEWLNLRAADENFVLDTLIASKSAKALGSAWFTEDAKTADEILNILSITDLTKIGLTGHSIGGATAVKLGRERDDISAVIDIDGTVFSEEIQEGSDVYVYNTEPYPVPYLDLSNTSANYYDVYSGKYRDEEGRLYINVYVINNALDAREYSIPDTEHMDFTDLPLLSPTLAKMLGKGTADSRKVIPEINRVCLNFFDYYLKGEGELIVEDWTHIE